MVDFLFEVVLGSFFQFLRWIYFRLRYPDKLVRARKLAEYKDSMPLINKVFGWFLICSLLLILLLLFYKLTGIFE